MKNYIKSNCIKAGFFVIFYLFFFLNIESVFADNRCKQKLDSLHILLSESTTPKSKADCYADIVHIYYTCDQIPQAIYNYKIAASIYLKENMFDLYCNQLESLGVMYAVSNDPKMGLFYFFKALEVTEKYHLDKMQYYSLIQNIGNMYMEAEEWTKGIKYYKLCESYFSSDSCKNKKYIIVNQTNIGYAYQKINLIDSALPYYDSAIKNSNKYSIKNYLSGVYMNLGEIYNQNKKYGKAKTLFLQSMEYCELYGDHRNYYRGLCGLGIVESNEKDYKMALNHLNTAIDYFSKNKDFIYARDAYHEICAIYEQKNDFKNYVKYSKLYDSAKDSIYARKNNSNMAAMQLRYEMEKIQEKSKSEIELLTKKSQFNKLRWVAVICILILSLGLSATLYFRHRINKRLMNVEMKNFQLEQKQLENEIYYKKRDIENMALHIVQKNEFLEQIKSDIKTLKDDIKPENQTKLKSISLKIAQSARKNKELEKLQENIDKINWVFIDKLTERFPALTEKEKRLCTLLKLNFNSKEIANLNNVSEDAVIKARHRMRKKMGLGPDENLTEFIHKI